MKMKKNFYQNKKITVLAKDLLGKVLCRRRNNFFFQGIINEVEVYDNQDPASHSYKGMTLRNKVMFAVAGSLYVYFIYGNYYCLNVVSGAVGVGEAILIRSLIPYALSGRNLQKVRANRHYQKKKLTNLLNGPGKICQGFLIDLIDNGLDLVKSKSIYLLDYGFKPSKILAQPRVGISKNQAKLLNFSFSSFKVS